MVSRGPRDTLPETLKVPDCHLLSHWFPQLCSALREGSQWTLAAFSGHGGVRPTDRGGDHGGQPDQLLELSHETEPLQDPGKRTFQVESTTFIWYHFCNKGRVDGKEERQPLPVKGLGKGWGARSGIVQGFGDGKEAELGDNFHHV